MAYLGGKASSADHILEILNDPLFDQFDYIEPFCGYCHILRRVINKKSYTASDNNEYLMTLLKHIQKTKGKHETITRAEYKEIKEHPDKNKLRTAYAGFTYTYHGKFFGRYVNTYKGRNYPKERKRYYDKLHENPSFHEAKLQWTSYKKYSGVKGKLIYCDPPYVNTEAYHNPFDSSAFWDWVRRVSKENYVFVSEYEAPSDFICVSKKMKRQSMSGRGATRKKQEKVFIHESKLKDPIMKQILEGVPAKSQCKRKVTRKVTKN